MPFLVPAVTALGSDVFVLWLSSRRPVGQVWSGAADDNGDNHDNDDGNNNSADHWVYHPDAWTAATAMVRLVLLLLPLLFHSYTGTAVRHVPWYQLFYGATVLLLLSYTLGLALLNPESLQAVVPWDAVHLNPPYTRRPLEHLHELRRIWWMLGLSGTSVGCHFVILWHVRSTAPAISLAAIMQRTSNSGGGGTSGGGAQQGNKTPTVYFALRATSNNNNNEQEPALMHAMNGTILSSSYMYHIIECSCMHVG